MKSALISLIPAVAISALCAVPAHASERSNAIDVCQGSLPSFEGALRKRPLAIANEGSSSSFVSCSMRVPGGDEEVIRLNVLFINRSPATRTFSCTLVDGVAEPFPGFPPVFQPKAIALATGAFGVLSWNHDADNGGEPYNLPNLNCSLPPGVEINVLEMTTETAT